MGEPESDSVHLVLASWPFVEHRKGLWLACPQTPALLRTRKQANQPIALQLVGAAPYRAGMEPHIDEAWLDRTVAQTPATDDSSQDADRLWQDMENWAVGFAASREDVSSGVLKRPARGLRADESRSFRRAVERGVAVVDDCGYVHLPAMRPKTPVGRYALLSKSGDGVSVNLEYLVQIGATGELVLDHGWAPAAVEFERGEFDALVVDEGRVVVAMEAKARVSGTDGLEQLVKHWLRLLDGRENEWRSNAGRKLRGLQALCNEGPVLVWLVADGARWSIWASSTSGKLSFSPGPTPGFPLAPPPDSDGAWKHRPFDALWHGVNTTARAEACSWHGPASCDKRPTISFEDAQGRRQSGCERAVQELIASGLLPSHAAVQ